MTDNQQWQSPSAPDVPSPQAQGYAADPQGARGWTPPPRPGLIPLRPLDFGTILGAPYRLLRRNPRPTFGMSLLLQGVILLISLAVVGTATFTSLSRVEFSATAADADEILAGSVAAILLSSLVPLALAVVATAIMQGIVVLEIARQSLGEKLRFRQLLALAKGRLLAVVGYSVALSGALVVGILLLVTVVAGGSLLGPAGVAIAVALAVLLGLGGVALAAFVGTKLAFVPSILLLERASLREAIGRSWQLTAGSFWRILGTLLLVALILNVASSIAATPLQIVSFILPAVLAPTGEETAINAVAVIVTVVSLLLTVVVSAVVLVVQSATTALLYIDQRMRREGLDLELTRYAEARQSGRDGARNPFAVASPGQTPPGPTPPGTSPGPTPPSVSPWT